MSKILLFTSLSAAQSSSDAPAGVPPHVLSEVVLAQYQCGSRDVKYLSEPVPPAAAQKLAAVGALGTCRLM